MKRSVALLAGGIAAVSMVITIPATAATAVVPSSLPGFGAQLHRAYIDEARPKAVHVDTRATQPVPVGATATSVQRAFFELDLSELPAGAQISDAEAGFTVDPGAGCEATHIDLYVVPAIESTLDWANQPAAGPRIGTAALSASTGTECTDFSSSFGVSVLSAVRQALAAGQPSITFELRDRSESDPGMARLISGSDPARLILDYDVRPGAPSQLTVGSPEQKCAGGAVVRASDGSPVFLGVTVGAALSPVQSVTYQIASADTSTTIDTLTEDGVGTPTTDEQVPTDDLTGLAGFAWRAQASDGTLTSTWSAWCQVAIDNTIPDEPTQSSADFGTTSRMGTEGVPGTIQISGGGPDAVGYIYALFGSPGTLESLDCNQPDVACVVPGGSASVTIVPPSFTFPFCVVAYSRTGEVSPESCVTYNVSPQVIGVPDHNWYTDGGVAGTSVPDLGGATPAPLVLHRVTVVPGSYNDFPGEPSSGFSLSFTGDGGIAATAAAIVDESKPFTVGAWLNPSSISGTQTLISAGDFSVSMLDGGSLQVCVGGTCATDEGAVGLGSWTFIGLEWDPAINTASLINDGELVSTDVQPHKALSGVARLQFGSRAAPYSGLVENPIEVSEAVVTSNLFVLENYGPGSSGD